MKCNSAWPMMVLLVVVLAGCGGGGSASSSSGAGSFPPPAPGLFLAEITEPAGIRNPTEHWPDGKYQTPEITPGGVALFDYDGDGDLDILQICHQRPGEYVHAARPGKNEPAPNRLFQQQPDGTFREIAGGAGLADPEGYGHGVAVGDIDNDGDLDVYISNYGQDRLFTNDGGRFTDVTAAAGIEQGHHWGSSVAFLDYDRDGDLDLWVCRFAAFNPDKICKGTRADAELDYCGPHTFDGVPDVLYRNNGDGTFKNVSKEAGIDLPSRSWGVVCADVTGDGWIDVYIANDEEAAQLWINQKNGTFMDEATLRGCAYNGDGRPEAGMGVTIGDFDNDGVFDLFKTHITSETNTLYNGLADGNYNDFTSRAGMAIVDRPYTGWGCGFFDFDHDGDQDIALVNGRVTRGPILQGAALGPFWNRFAEPKLLFRNDGKGRFEDVRAQTGAFASRAEVSRGLAFGDLDNDGDFDLVVNNLDNTLRIFRNDAPAEGTHWLMVRPISGRRDAIGALITAVVGQRRMLRVAHPAYSFLSSNDLRVHFGLGAGAKVDALEVVWPDGRREKFSVPAVDRHLTITQGQGEAMR
jgi:hypothetical protein